MNVAHRGTQRPPGVENPEGRGVLKYIQCQSLKMLNLQTSHGWIWANMSEYGSYMGHSLPPSHSIPWVTCLVTWPLTCTERDPCWCHKHNLLVGTSQSSICKRPKSNQLRNGFANCPEMTQRCQPGSHGPIGRSWSMRLPLCPDLRECHNGHEKGSHKYTCLCPDFRECQDGTWKGFL